MDIYTEIFFVFSVAALTFAHLATHRSAFFNSRSRHKEFLS